MDEREEIEQVQPAGEQEPGGLVPPYEGRQTEMKEGYEEHTEKVFHGADDVPPGPGREISDEEREGVPPTDTEATSPLGVGVSMTRRGEDVGRQESEPGREDTGTKGASDRPVGVSDERASTSVDPDETESGGPTLPAGDQGG
ncbi:MAG TPA: hypothetical protein VF468_09185 [Actinomycetota bacterium]|nr:hypothetical protein [Actinomycetota bacterium]